MSLCTANWADCEKTHPSSRVEANSLSQRYKHRPLSRQRTNSLFQGYKQNSPFQGYHKLGKDNSFTSLSDDDDENSDCYDYHSIRQRDLNTDNRIC